MILYIGTAEAFIEDNKSMVGGRKAVVGKLIEAFEDKFRRKPDDPEIRSWENSLQEVASIFEDIGLKEQGVLLDYQLPLSSKRLDCMVIGTNNHNETEVIIIELKQWQSCKHSTLDNAVLTLLGGKDKLVLHPSVQIENYLDYLKNATNLFSNNVVEGPINLGACVYLHNYKLKENDELISDKFKDVLKEYPVFVGDDRGKLKLFLKEKVSYGYSKEAVDKVINLKFETSKKLNDLVTNVINGKSEYVLLDEQFLVFKAILAAESSKNVGKKVIIVKGGPGTGKSVIAINALAHFLKEGKKANYSTGSKWFTRNLKNLLKKNGDIYFKYFNNYDNANNILDVLICDESHRIRNEISYSSKLLQVEQIIRSSKVSIFFIDDKQQILPKEIGSTAYIRKYAKEYESKTGTKVAMIEFNLEVQFRCGGMDGFVRWIDRTLDIDKDEVNDSILWSNKNEEFDFRIFQYPLVLENELKDRIKEGATARITAGFCWPWNEKGNAEGTLVNDVKIADYERPWNPSDNLNYKAKQNPTIPLPEEWSRDPNGINQIGCVYTMQGFEYDYIGVIFAEDLVYNWNEGKWVGNKEKSCDSQLKKSKEEEFTKALKHIYRVLLSRGMKGCYVYFMDKNTESFFRSRME